MMRRQMIVFVLAAITITTTLSAADSDSPAFTNPKEAGLEYEIQGEYRGVAPFDGEATEFGVQIIALGDGKFQGIGYPGGLPGDGWSRGDEKHEHFGELQGEILVFDADGLRVEVSDGEVRLHLDEGVVKLPKVNRKSPTLHSKPPEGAHVIFDGSSLEHVENGKLVDEKWLGATGVVSKKKLGDHELHIEFRTPFMPKARGQGRGNSGVYIQSRYELQVLDSFGLAGLNNECGGIYSISEPAVNMCLPPLSWQTYDISFTAAKYDDNGEKTQNARATVKHNGVVIHDDLELTHGTPGRLPEGPDPAPLFLQDHGNPVVFRNIWVVER